MPVYPLSEVYKDPKRTGFQIRFRHEGLTYKKNYPNLSKKQAELLEGSIKAKLAMGELHKPGDDVFIVFAKEALPEWAKDHWARPDDVEKYLASFEEFFKQKRFNEISPLLIEAYKLKIKKVKTKRKDEFGENKQRSEKTVNRYMAVLSRCWWLAVKKKLVKENPCKDVERYKEGPGVVRWLSDDEYARLEYALQFQPDYLRVIVTLAMNTALRWGNLINLRMYDVNFNSNCLELAKTKSGQPLSVPLSEKARAALEVWIEAKQIKKGFLFANPRTGKPYTTVRKSLMTLLEHAEIENFTFHCFRHDAITLMVDSGIPLQTVAEIAGHQKIDTTRKYAHVKEDRKRQAIELLGQRSTTPRDNVVQFKQKTGNER